MEYIGVVAGKSGEAIAKEVHKWNQKIALIIGREDEPGADVADVVFCSDLSNKKSINDFFVKHGVRKVIFGTGHILAIELAEVLEKNGMLVNIIPEISKLCNNKYELKKVLERIGLYTPRYCKVEKDDNIIELIQKWEFPIVLKSIRDYVEPQLIHNEEDLIDNCKLLFKNEPSVMLEEYIQGNDCSVVVSNTGTTVKSVGVLYWSKAHEDNLKGFFESFSEPLDEIMEECVRRAAEDIIKYINVRGLPRVDIIVKNNIPYILEINSIIFSKNTGSCYTISSRQKGINSPKIIVDNAMNYFMTTEKKKYRRQEDAIVFVDEDCCIEEIENDIPYKQSKFINGVPLIENAYLFPDTVKNIRKFIDDKGLTMSRDDETELMKYIAFINKENPDNVMIFCTGKRKALLELAKEFLRRK